VKRTSSKTSPNSNLPTYAPTTTESLPKESAKIAHVCYMSHAHATSSHASGGRLKCVFHPKPATENDVVPPVAVFTLAAVFYDPLVGS